MGVYSKNRSTINESYIFSGDDIVLNFDKWKANTPNNILYVTGLSGSGKSTLAEEYEKKYNAEMFELDGIEGEYDSSKSNLLQKLRDKYPDYNIGVKNGFKDYSDYEYYELFIKYTTFIISEIKKSGKLFIIEGLQIFENLDPDTLKSKPLIIKGSSVTKSIYQKCKREGNYKKIDWIAELKTKNLSFFKHCVIAEKKLNKFRKGVKESTILESAGSNIKIDIENNTLVHATMAYLNVVGFDKENTEYGEARKDVRLQCKNILELEPRLKKYYQDYFNNNKGHSYAYLLMALHLDADYNIIKPNTANKDYNIKTSETIQYIKGFAMVLKSFIENVYSKLDLILLNKEIDQYKKDFRKEEKISIDMILSMFKYVDNTKKSFYTKVIPSPLDSHMTGYAYSEKDYEISITSTDNYMIMIHEYVHGYVNPIILENTKYHNKFKDAFNLSVKNDYIKNNYNNLSTFIYECATIAVDYNIKESDDIIFNMYRSQIGTMTKEELFARKVKQSYDKACLLVPYFYNYFKINRSNMSFKDMIISSLKDYKEDDYMLNESAINENSIDGILVNGKTYLQESENKSKIDIDYKSKGHMNLSSFNKTKLTRELAKENGVDYGETTFQDFKGYLYTDKKDNSIKVALLAVATDDDKKSWIQPVKVYKKYKGYGLSKQLLDVAVKELGAKYLSVYPDNTLAIDIYKKYGFKIYKKNKWNMYLMTLDPNQKIDKSYINENSTILLEAGVGRRWKCPYCNFHETRERLVDHVEKEHSEMLSEDFSAARAVFNYINKKEHGTCIVCRKETKFSEDTWRYNRLCDNPKCEKEYIDSFKKNMIGKHGVVHMLNDPEQQIRMLANRKISGTYKFADGGIRSYCGTYEKKALEFYDKVMNVHSKDVITPGPVIEYEYNGKMLKWITDIYYVPANLVHDVKDGGASPNNRQMDDYRAKQIAKEDAISKMGKYNYIRLTDNSFDQLLLILAEIKSQMMDNVKDEYVIRINESLLLEAMKPIKKLYHLSETNLDGNILQPRIPNNYMTKNGYEDNKTPRISFSKTIDGALMGISMRMTGKKLYVHVVDESKKYTTKTITNKQVPDSKITGEVWVTTPVKLKVIGQIEILNDAGEDGIPYKYGDKTAELYKWNWKWINKYINESELGGAMPNQNNQSNNVYIVPYMMNMTFDIGLSTDKYFSNLYKIKDGKIQKGTIEDLYEAKYSVYKYNGNNVKELHEIIKNAYDDQIDIENKFYLYETVCGKKLLSQDQFEFDEMLEECVDGFIEAAISTQIHEATLWHQFNKENHSILYTELISILDINAKNNIKYDLKGCDILQDINGYFIHNETTERRTKSYDSISVIPYVYAIVEKLSK